MCVCRSGGGGGGGGALFLACRARARFGGCSGAAGRHAERQLAQCGLSMGKSDAVLSRDLLNNRILFASHPLRGARGPARQAVASVTIGLLVPWENCEELARLASVTSAGSLFSRRVRGRSECRECPATSVT